MKKKKRKYALFLLTILCSAILARSPAFAANPAIQRVPKGWTATEEISYVMNEEAARQTVIALETYEEKLGVWQTAYDELWDKAERYRLDMESRWARMDKQLKDMEAAHGAEVKAAKRRGQAPGFGVFAGVGYGSGGEFTPVIGVGVVWKVF